MLRETSVQSIVYHYTPLTLLMFLSTIVPLLLCFSSNFTAIMDVFSAMHGPKHIAAGVTFLTLELLVIGTFFSKLCFANFFKLELIFYRPISIPVALLRPPLQACAYTSKDAHPSPSMGSSPSSGSAILSDSLVHLDVPSYVFTHLPLLPLSLANSTPCLQEGYPL